jgi:hypothetical protein
VRPPHRCAVGAEGSWASTARRARGASFKLVPLFALFIRTRDARAIDYLCLALDQRRRDLDTMLDQKRDQVIASLSRGHLGFLLVLHFRGQRLRMHVRWTPGAMDAQMPVESAGSKERGQPVKTHESTGVGELAEIPAISLSGRLRSGGISSLEGRAAMPRLNVINHGARRQGYPGRTARAAVSVSNWLRGNRRNHE